MKSLRFLSLLLSFLFITGAAFAQEEGGHGGPVVVGEDTNHGGEEKLDVAGEIFGHVADAHSIHLFDLPGGPVSIPLPVIAYSPTKGLSIFSSSVFGHHWHKADEHGNLFKDANGKLAPQSEGKSPEGYYLTSGIKEKLLAEDGSEVYDFSITKNVVAMLLSIIILLWIMLSVAKKYKANGAMKAPSGLQNAIEPLITFIRDEVAKPNLGYKYMRFMPLLLTLFFFIWINNMLGLLPFGFNFTGNIAVTLMLAIISFIVMIVNANKHFWSHLLNPPGVPFGVKLLLVPIEIISLFVKPVALTIRLFANILAGHIVILSVVFIIFIFAKMSVGAGWGFSIVSVAFAIFMFFLELLVAVIQAFIFTNLTAVFLGQAIEEAHHHDAEHEDYHKHNPHTGQEYNVGTQEVIA